MRVATFALVLLLVPCDSAFAAFTDFSDYTQRERFGIGEVIQSNGLAFKVIDLVPTLSFAAINASPPFAELYAGPGVEFLLPANTREVSFHYGTGGGRLLTINGVEPDYVIPDVSLSFLDGTTVAGVAVSTVVERQGGTPGGRFGITSEAGIFTLRGPLTSFAIAGVELFIDDVSIIVPEPATAALLLVASISLFATRRRQRA